MNQHPVSPAALINALPLALLVLDAKGRVLEVNPAAEEMIGTSAKRVRDKHLSELWPEQQLTSLIPRALQTGSEVVEHRHRLANFYQELEVHARLVPFGEENSAIMLLLEPYGRRDALAAEETKQRIAEASSLMAAMLAHEIKNPLAGIRGAAQLLAGEGEEQHALSQLICREVDRIRDMVERVESLTDAKELPLQPVNVYEVLRDACELTRAGAVLSIQERFDPSLPMVIGDRMCLMQVLVNILKNASEALEAWPEAEILLKTSVSHVHARHAGGDDAISYAVIDIEDNGPGIPPELKARLFEPFTTTRGRGRGLGLAIAARLLSDMHGHIELMPATNGAHFRILLPLAQETALEGAA